jgi:hypothetical protein
MKTNTKTTKKTAAVKEMSATLAAPDLAPAAPKAVDTKFMELNAHVAKLQSENSKHLKFQAKVAIVLDKLEELNGFITFPKKVNLAWILANLTRLPKIIAIVKEAIEEIKAVKNS